MGYDVTPASPLPVRIALDACVAGSVPLRADPVALTAAQACSRSGVEIAVVGGTTPHDPLRTLAASESLREPDAERVRATRLSSVRVAAKDVRDGRSDIFVATGPPGPALAAAQFSFGLIRGAGAPALAWIFETDSAPLILVGADHSPVNHLLGEVLARVLLGIEAPRTGNLVTGHLATGHLATGHLATGHLATGHPATGWPAGPSAASLVTGSDDHDVLITPVATALALLQVLAATGRPAPPALVLGLTALAVIDVAGSRPEHLLDLAVRAVRGNVQKAVEEALEGFVRERRKAAGLENRHSETPDGAQSQM